MPNEIYPDGVSPEQADAEPVAPLVDEPDVDTGYDPGNPWWRFCHEQSERDRVEREARAAAWAAMTPEEQRAELARNRHAREAAMNTVKGAE